MSAEAVSSWWTGPVSNTALALKVPTFASLVEKSGTTLSETSPAPSINWAK